MPLKAYSIDMGWEGAIVMFDEDLDEHVTPRFREHLAKSGVVGENLESLLEVITEYPIATDVVIEHVGEA